MAGAGSVQGNVLDFSRGGNVQRSINNELQMMVRPMLCFISRVILLALISCRLKKYLRATWILFVFMYKLAGTAVTNTAFHLSWRRSRREVRYHSYHNHFTTLWVTQRRVAKTWALSSDRGLLKLNKKGYNSLLIQIFGIDFFIGAQWSFPKSHFPFFRGFFKGYEEFFLLLKTVTHDF